MKINLFFCNEYRLNGNKWSFRFCIWGISCLLSILVICVGCKNTDIPLETTTYSFKKISPTNNFDVEAEVNVDFPVRGKKELKNNIIDFFLEALTEKYTFDEEKNPQYEGDTSDGQSIVNHFGNEKIKELQIMGVGDAHIFINKVFETDKFISYLVDYYGNAGGAGIGTKYGATFNKESGDRVQLIKDPNNEQFKKFLIGSVEDVVISQNQKDMYDKSELTSHPFPQYPPFLTKKGICFIYQKYEIGAGPLGQVEVNILVEQIAEYLSDVLVNSDDGDDGTKLETVDNSEQSIKLIREWYKYVLGEKVYSEDILDQFLSSDIKKSLWTEDYEGCYQFWKFRTDACDSNPEGDISKVESINYIGDMWYEIKYFDMGWKGTTKVKVEKGKIVDFVKDKSWNQNV